MFSMKFIKFIKMNIVEIAFILLIAGFWYLYFFTYMTPSRVAWYNEMEKQTSILIYEIMNIGR